MNAIWKRIDRWNVRPKVKYLVFLTMMTLAYALVGGVVWALAGRYFLPSYEWLACFIGYPAVTFGGMGGILHLYKYT